MNSNVTKRLPGDDSASEDRSGVVEGIAATAVPSRGVRVMAASDAPIRSPLGNHGTAALPTHLARGIPAIRPPLHGDQGGTLRDCFVLSLALDPWAREQKILLRRDNPGNAEVYQLMMWARKEEAPGNGTTGLQGASSSSALPTSAAYASAVAAMKAATIEAGADGQLSRGGAAVAGSFRSPYASQRNILRSQLSGAIRRSALFTNPEEALMYLRSTKFRSALTETPLDEVAVVEPSALDVRYFPSSFHRTESWSKPLGIFLPGPSRRRFLRNVLRGRYRTIGGAHNVSGHDATSNWTAEVIAQRTMANAARKFQRILPKVDSGAKHRRSKKLVESKPQQALPDAVAVATKRSLARSIEYRRQQTAVASRRCYARPSLPLSFSLDLPRIPHEAFKSEIVLRVKLSRPGAVEGSARDTTFIAVRVHLLDSLSQVRQKIIDAARGKSSFDMLTDGSWSFTEFSPPAFRLLRDLLHDFKTFYTDTSHVMLEGALARDVMYAYREHQSLAARLEPEIWHFTARMESMITLAEILPRLRVATTTTSKDAPDARGVRCPTPEFLAAISGHSDIAACPLQLFGSHQRRYLGWSTRRLLQLVKPVRAAILAQLDRQEHFNHFKIAERPPSECAIHPIRLGWRQTIRVLVSEARRRRLAGAHDAFVQEIHRLSSQVSLSDDERKTVKLGVRQLSQGLLVPEVTISLHNKGLTERQGDDADARDIAAAECTSLVVAMSNEYDALRLRSHSAASPQRGPRGAVDILSSQHCFSTFGLHVSRAAVATQYHLAIERHRSHFHDQAMRRDLHSSVAMISETEYRHIISRTAWIEAIGVAVNILREFHPFDAKRFPSSPDGSVTDGHPAERLRLPMMQRFSSILRTVYSDALQTHEMSKEKWSGQPRTGSPRKRNAYYALEESPAEGVELLRPDEARAAISVTGSIARLYEVEFASDLLTIEAVEKALALKQLIPTDSKSVGLSSSREESQAPSTHAPTPITRIIEAARTSDTRCLDVAVNIPSRPTLLHLAVGMGHPVLAFTLMCLGADAHAIDSHGETPMHWAVERNDPISVRVIIESQLRRHKVLRFAMSLPTINPPTQLQRTDDKELAVERWRQSCEITATGSDPKRLLTSESARHLRETPLERSIRLRHWESLRALVHPSLFPSEELEKVDELRFLTHAQAKTILLYYPLASIFSNNDVEMMEFIFLHTRAASLWSVVDDVTKETPLHFVTRLFAAEHVKQTKIKERDGTETPSIETLRFLLGLVAPSLRGKSDVGGYVHPLLLRDSLGRTVLHVAACHDATTAHVLPLLLEIAWRTMIPPPLEHGPASVLFVPWDLMRDAVDKSGRCLVATLLQRVHEPFVYRGIALLQEFQRLVVCRKRNSSGHFDNICLLNKEGCDQVSDEYSMADISKYKSVHTHGSLFDRQLLLRKCTHGNTVVHLMAQRRLTDLLASAVWEWCRFNSTDIVELASSKNADGDTPLGVAIRADFSSGVELILGCHRLISETSLQVSLSQDRSPLLFAVDRALSARMHDGPFLSLTQIEDERPHCETRLRHSVLRAMLATPVDAQSIFIRFAKAGQGFSTTDDVFTKGSSSSPPRSSSYINRGSGKLGDTPLLAAVRAGPRAWHVVALLLSFGARVNVANRRGETPVQIAASSQHDVSLVQLLLANDCSAPGDYSTLRCIILEGGAASRHRDVVPRIYDREHIDLNVRARESSCRAFGHRFEPSTIDPEITLGRELLCSAAAAGNFDVLGGLMRFFGARDSGISEELSPVTLFLKSLQFERKVVRGNCLWSLPRRGSGGYATRRYLTLLPDPWEFSSDNEEWNKFGTAHPCWAMRRHRNVGLLERTTGTLHEQRPGLSRDVVVSVVTTMLTMGFSLPPSTLVYALSAGLMEIVRLLLDNDRFKSSLDPNAKCAVTGRTALHLAALYAMHDGGALFSELITWRSVDPTIKDNSGADILRLGASLNCPKIVICALLTQRYTKALPYLVEPRHLKVQGGGDPSDTPKEFVRNTSSIIRFRSPVLNNVLDLRRASKNGHQEESLRSTSDVMGAASSSAIERVESSAELSMRSRMQSTLLTTGGRSSKTRLHPAIAFSLSRAHLPPSYILYEALLRGDHSGFASVAIDEINFIDRAVLPIGGGYPSVRVPRRFNLLASPRLCAGKSRMKRLLEYVNFKESVAGERIVNPSVFRALRDALVTSLARCDIDSTYRLRHFLYGDARKFAIDGVWAASPHTTSTFLARIIAEAEDNVTTETQGLHEFATAVHHALALDRFPSLSVAAESTAPRWSRTSSCRCAFVEWSNLTDTEAGTHTTTRPAERLVDLQHVPRSLQRFVDHANRVLQPKTPYLDLSLRLTVVLEDRGKFYESSKRPYANDPRSRTPDGTLGSFSNTSIASTGGLSSGLFQAARTASSCLTDDCIEVENPKFLTIPAPPLLSWLSFLTLRSISTSEIDSSFNFLQNFGMDLCCAVPVLPCATTRRERVDGKSANSSQASIGVAPAPSVVSESIIAMQARAHNPIDYLLSLPGYHAPSMKAACDHIVVCLLKKMIDLEQQQKSLPVNENTSFASLCKRNGSNESLREVRNRSRSPPGMNTSGEAMSRRQTLSVSGPSGAHGDRLKNEGKRNGEPLTFEQTFDFYRKAVSLRDEVRSTLRVSYLEVLSPRTLDLCLRRGLTQSVRMILAQPYLALRCIDPFYRVMGSGESLLQVLCRTRCYVPRSVFPATPKVELNADGCLAPVAEAATDAFGFIVEDAQVITALRLSRFTSAQTAVAASWWTNLLIGAGFHNNDSASMTSPMTLNEGNRTRFPCLSLLHSMKGATMDPCVESTGTAGDSLLHVTARLGRHEVLLRAIDDHRPTREGDSAAIVELEPLMSRTPQVDGSLRGGPTAHSNPQILVSSTPLVEVSFAGASDGQQTPTSGAQTPRSDVFGRMAEEETMKRLLHQLAGFVRVDTLNNSGRTPLMEAVRHSSYNTECVGCLLRRGASLTVEDARGANVMAYAARFYSVIRFDDGATTTTDDTDPRYGVGASMAASTTLNMNSSAHTLSRRLGEGLTRPSMSVTHTHRPNASMVAGESNATRGELSSRPVSAASSVSRRKVSLVDVDTEADRILRSTGTTQSVVAMLLGHAETQESLALHRVFLSSPWKHPVTAALMHGNDTVALAFMSSELCPKPPALLKIRIGRYKLSILHLAAASDCSRSLRFLLANCPTSISAGSPSASIATLTVNRFSVLDFSPPGSSTEQIIIDHLRTLRKSLFSADNATGVHGAAKEEGGLAKVTSMGSHGGTNTSAPLGCMRISSFFPGFLFSKTSFPQYVAQPARQVGLFRALTSGKAFSLFTGFAHPNAVCTFNHDPVALQILLDARPSDLQRQLGAMTIDARAWHFARTGRDADLLKLLQLGRNDLRRLRITGLPPIMDSERSRTKLCRDIAAALFRFGGVDGAVKLNFPPSYNSQPFSSSGSSVLPLRAGGKTTLAPLKISAEDAANIPMITPSSATLLAMDEQQIPKLLKAEILLEGCKAPVIIERDDPLGPSYRFRPLVPVQLSAYRPEGGRHFLVEENLLHVAAWSKCNASLRFVIDNNSSQGLLSGVVARLLGQAFDFSGLSVFHIAALTSNLTLIGDFIRAKVPLSKDASLGLTPLQMFPTRGHLLLAAMALPPLHEKLFQERVPYWTSLKAVSRRIPVETAASQSTPIVGMQRRGSLIGLNASITDLNSSRSAAMSSRARLAETPRVSKALARRLSFSALVNIGVYEAEEKRAMPTEAEHQEEIRELDAIVVRGRLSHRDEQALSMAMLLGTGNQDWLRRKAREAVSAHIGKEDMRQKLVGVFSSYVRLLRQAAALGEENSNPSSDKLAHSVAQQLRVFSRALFDRVASAVENLHFDIDTSGADERQSNVEREQFKQFVMYSIEGGSGSRVFIDALQHLLTQSSFAGWLCLLKLRSISLTCAASANVSKSCTITVDTSGGTHVSLEFFPSGPERTLFVPSLVDNLADHFCTDAVTGALDLSRAIRRHSKSGNLFSTAIRDRRFQLLQRIVDSLHQGCLFEEHCRVKGREDYLDAQLAELRMLTSVYARSADDAASSESRGIEQRRMLVDSFVIEEAIATMTTELYEQEAAPSLAGRKKKNLKDIPATIDEANCESTKRLCLGMRSFLVPNDCTITLLFVPSNAVEVEGSAIKRITEFEGLALLRSAAADAKSRRSHHEATSNLDFLSLLWKSRTRTTASNRLLCVCPLEPRTSHEDRSRVFGRAIRGTWVSSTWQRFNPRNAYLATYDDVQFHRSPGLLWGASNDENAQILDTRQVLLAPVIEASRASATSVSFGAKSRFNGGASFSLTNVPGSFDLPGSAQKSVNLRQRQSQTDGMKGSHSRSITSLTPRSSCRSTAAMFSLRYTRTPASAQSPPPSGVNNCRFMQPEKAATLWARFCLVAAEHYRNTALELGARGIDAGGSIFAATTERDDDDASSVGGTVVSSVGGVDQIARARVGMSPFANPTRPSPTSSAAGDPFSGSNMVSTTMSFAVDDSNEKDHGHRRRKALPPLVMMMVELYAWTLDEALVFRLGGVCRSWRKAVLHGTMLALLTDVRNSWIKRQVAFVEESMAVARSAIMGKSQIRDESTRDDSGVAGESHVRAALHRWLPVGTLHAAARILSVRDVDEVDSAVIRFLSEPLFVVRSSSLRRGTLDAARVARFFAPRRQTHYCANWDTPQSQHENSAAQLAAQPLAMIAMYFNVAHDYISFCCRIDRYLDLPSSPRNQIIRSPKAAK